MLRMFSCPRRPQSGQITCYLNRTYHVLATQIVGDVVKVHLLGHHAAGAGVERSEHATPPELYARQFAGCDPVYVAVKSRERAAQHFRVSLHRHQADHRGYRVDVR